MRIVPNQVFLHGRDRYKPGTTYEVGSKLGNYFIANGWAELDQKRDRWYRRVKKRG